MLKVKDNALAELKEQLIAKQESLANLDVSVQRHSDEMKKWKEESQKELGKISGLQQEIAQKLEGLVVTRSSMPNQLVQNSSSTMTSFADKQQTMLHALADKDRMIDELQIDNAKYTTELNEAKDVMSQQKLELLSTKQKLTDNEKEMIYLKEQLRVKDEALADLNEKEMMEQLKVKDEALAKLNNELILEKNSFDVAVTEYSIELEGLKKVTQEQSDELLTLQKDVEEKEEQLVMSRNEISSLRCELTQQSDLLSAETDNKQAMIDELADKERIINTLESYIVWYRAETNNAKKSMQQLKIEQLSMRQELADNAKVMMAKLKAKDEALAALEDEIIEKQNSFDSIINNYSEEMEKLQVTQEQSEKILNIEKEMVQKEEELVMTTKQISDLHYELTQQSDLLTTEKADKQSMKCELADKNQFINELQSDIAMYKVEVKDTKEMLSQLKMECSLQKQKCVDNEKEMEEKKRVKDESLAELKEEMFVKQYCLDDMNTKRSDELEEWKKESQEQLNKISTLQEEVVAKEEKLAAIESEMSNLHHRLMQQTDLLSSITTSYADKEQTFQYVLADKERTIGLLQADNEMYKSEMNDAKETVQQLQMSNLSMKQELANAETEMMEKIRDTDEALTKLKEELTIKQNSFDVAISKHSSDMHKWQKQSKEQSDKITTLQKEVAATEEELVATKKEMSDLSEELVKQSDLLSAEMADKQKMKDALANKQRINWRIVDKLEQDNQTYRAQLEDAEDLIQQFKMEQSSIQQHLADIEKEMTGRIRIQDEEMVELKKELIEKQKSFDAAVSKHSDELEGLQKVTQEQVLALQKSIAGKDEEIDAMRNEISDLHHQLAQQSGVLSGEMVDKQKMKLELTDKEKMIEMLKADTIMYKIELNDAKELISQLELEQLSMKQQLANNEKETIEMIRDKDEMLAKLKEDLITKQDSLADMDFTIRRHTSELEEWQKESQEHLDKILSLQQEVEEKGEELTLTKSEMSNLHHQLMQQSDLFSTTMKDYAEKEKAFESTLVDKQRIIDTLQSDIEMYTTKLNDSKDLMQQLKTEQLSEKQQLEKEMMEKLEMKDKALAALEEQLIAKQSILDDTVSRHSVELMTLKKNFEDQSNSYSTLQREIAEKEAELVATRKEISDLNDKLMQQSDLAACTQTMKLALTDKERIISDLKEDIVKQQTEASNTKHQMSQLEREYLSVKQELASKTKEVGDKSSARSQAIAKLKEETFAKQNSLVDASDFKKQSIELDMLKMKYQGQLDKIKSLKKDVYKKSEELLATKLKMDDLNRQLKQQSNQMNEAIADKDRMIKTLQAEVQIYKDGVNDTKGQIEFKVEPSPVKQELEKMEMLESVHEAKQSNGALNVKQELEKREMIESGQEAKQSNGASNVKQELEKKEMLEPIQEAKQTDGASNVQNQEKQLPHDKPKAEQDTKKEEVKVIPNKIQPVQRANDIMNDSCKEVSHN